MATNPYDSVGKAVQTQANKALSQLQNGAQASVQQFVGDKLNTGMGFIDSAIKNVTSELFTALGFAKLARSINLPSSETGKVDSKVASGFESTTRGSDWRVKLSIPASPQNMNANLLAPLQNGRPLFSNYSYNNYKSQCKLQYITACAYKLPISNL